MPDGAETTPEGGGQARRPPEPPGRATILALSAMRLDPARFADVVVLAPRGRIDHATAEDLRTALAPHLARCGQGQDHVVLDFAGVDYISSAGLRVLMLAAKQAKAQGGFLAMDGEQQDEAIREIEAALPDDLNLVLETVYLAYYSDERVHKRIGWRTGPLQPRSSGPTGSS